MLAVTAFVLAGGKSSRMGRDKALVELAGRSLLQRALDLARSLTPSVRVVGHPEKFAPYAYTVPDIYSGRGPLGGIHAALTASTTDSNLILAVDLPFLTSNFLQYVIAESESSGAVVTVPHAAGYLHPLCAVYRKEFLSFAERALAQSHNKLDALLAEVATEAIVRVIPEPELNTAGFTSAIFRNLNTPEDLAAT